MKHADTRRYPTSYFTREHLEPIETFRDTVLLRDEHACAASDLARAFGRCSSTLTVVSAIWPALRTEHATNPLFLRTFCTSHADIDRAYPALAERWEDSGWRIPRTAEEPLVYAGLLPVRGPGDTWWLLDNWGERHSVGRAWAADIRAERRGRRP